MTRTITITPVRKSVVVQADQARAFDLFTAGIDRWWPRSHGIGASPIRESVIEPFVGGRWYTRCEDGSQVTTGHILAWEPGRRVAFSWEINSDWKPDSSTPSEVELTFIPEGPGTTRAQLEHRLFERMGKDSGEKMRKDVDGGWPGLLDMYAKEVAGQSN